MIAVIAAGGAAVFLALTLVRLHAGPTLHDRALAVNSAVAKTVLLIAALGVVSGQIEAIDAALALAVGGFVLTAGILKFFRAGTFQSPMVRAGED